MNSAIPSMEMLRNMVHLIAFTVEVQGGKIFIHCHGGDERTGLAIACYLAYSTYMSAVEILDLVRSKRFRCLRNVRYVQKFEAFKKLIDDCRDQYPNKVANYKVIS